MILTTEQQEAYSEYIGQQSLPLYQDLLRLPGYCEPCQVYGAEKEPNCWVCGNEYTKRRTAPGAGTSGGSTNRNAPTWRQVMGQDPYEDAPDRLEALLNGTTIETPAVTAAGSIPTDAELYHYLWTGYGAFAV